MVARAHALAWLPFVALLGCECAEDPPPATTSAATSLVPPSGARPSVEPVVEVVPTTELPEASVERSVALTPMVIVEVSARGYRVTNRVLVEDWPPADRERVHAGAPPDSPDFPLVELALPWLDEAPLLVPGVRDALSRALRAERERAGGAAAPRAFALRAAATLSWGRIARAMFTAAAAGLVEPSIVVRAGAQERAVRLTRPADGATRAVLVDLGAALGAAVRGLPPAEAPPVESPPGLSAAAPAPAPPAADVPAATAPTATLWFSLETHGLRVRRGLVELEAGCRSPGTGASPTIPLGALDDGHTLGDCLAALGEGTASFSASADVTHGTASLVLEHLAHRGPVRVVLGAP